MNDEYDYDISEISFFLIRCENCGISTAPHTDPDSATADALRLGFVAVHASEDGTLNFCKSCNNEEPK